MENQTITIPVQEYARLKDIETRFTIIKEQMLHAEYCPIHTQVILGIENQYKPAEYVLSPLLEKKFNVPDPDAGNQYFDDMK